MAALGIGLFGGLRVERDGHPVRFRTVQQGLLLARLALAEGSLERSELAASLWPQAERENALAYLRRSVMELRKAGIEIVAPGSRLSLDPHSFDCDVHDLLHAVEGTFSLLPSAAVLGDLEHPAADEIRERIGHLLHERQREKAAPPPVAAKGISDLNRWLWEALLRERPEVVSTLLSQHAVELVYEFPSEPLLEVALQTLQANPPLGAARATVRHVAARSAHVLTRYTLAERLYREALADAEAIGNREDALRIRAQLAFLYMERRQWGESRALFMRCCEEADALGTPDAIEAAHTNFAGLLWHLLEFDASVKSYLRAIEVAPPLKRIVPVANLAYLWGVFGVPPGMDFTELPEASNDGYRGLAEIYLQFSCGMGDHDAVRASVGAARLVELTAKSGMERLFCVAVDCAAMALARMGRPERAAACVRLGSRVRRDVDHRRSPGECLAIRRNVAPPYHGPDVAAAADELRSDDPVCLGKTLVGFLQGA